MYIQIGRIDPALTAALPATTADTRHIYRIHLERAIVLNITLENTGDTRVGATFACKYVRAGV